MLRTFLLLLPVLLLLLFPPKISQHSDREALYKELTETPGVIWATSEVGSRRIDEINILEATKEAMTVRGGVVLPSPVSDVATTTTTALS